MSYRDAGADADTRRVRGWRRWWVALYAGLTTVVVGAIVLGAALGRHRHPGRHVDWTVLVVIVVVVVVVLTGVGVVAWRVQSRPGPNRQLLAAGNWRTNRRVGIALRRGRTIDASDRRAAQALVNVYARRRWVVWFYAGLGVFWLAISFAYHGFELVLHVTLGPFLPLVHAVLGAASPPDSAQRGSARSAPGRPVRSLMSDRTRARRAVWAVAGTGTTIALLNLLIAAFLTHRDLGGPTGLLVGVLLFGTVGLAMTRSPRS